MTDSILPLLEVSNLRKIYNKDVAVSDISFSVQNGSCFGLLGPNGAGKTTTIEIIEDIIKPTSGSIRYKDAPRKASFREEIGIQFQHTSLFNFLTVKETLTTFSLLFKEPEDLNTLITTCQLNSILDRRTEHLSGGQSQRLLLALALINKPSLVFLDEPSTGLDPQARRNLWAIVKGICNNGKTVIMTTHSMEEAEYLCDTVAIMDKGTIIAEGSPTSLIQTYCRNATIHLPSSFNVEGLRDLDLNWSKEIDGTRIDCENIDHTLALLARAGLDLSGMSISSANLEDVFLRLTGRQLRD